MFLDGVKMEEYKTREEAFVAGLEHTLTEIIGKQPNFSKDDIRIISGKFNHLLDDKGNKPRMLLSCMAFGYGLGYKNAKEEQRECVD